MARQNQRLAASPCGCEIVRRSVAAQCPGAGLLADLYMGCFRQCARFRQRTLFGESDCAAGHRTRRTALSRPESRLRRGLVLPEVCAAQRWLAPVWRRVVSFGTGGIGDRSLAISTLRRASAVLDSA